MGNAEISPEFLKALSEARTERIRNELKAQEENYAIGLQRRIQLRECREFREELLRFLFNFFVNLTIIFELDGDRKWYNYCFHIAEMLHYLTHHREDFSDIAQEFVIELMMRFLDPLSTAMTLIPEDSLDSINKEILRYVKQGIALCGKGFNDIGNKIDRLKGQNEEAKYTTPSVVGEACAKWLKRKRKDDAKTSDSIRIKLSRALKKNGVAPFPTTQKGKYFLVSDLLRALVDCGYIRNDEEAAYVRDEIPDAKIKREWDLKTRTHVNT